MAVMIIAISIIIVIFGSFFIIRQSMDDKPMPVRVKTKRQKELEKRIKELEEGATDVKDDWYLHTND